MRTSCKRNIFIALVLILINAASASALTCEKEAFLEKLSQLKTSTVEFEILGAEKVDGIDLCEYVVRSANGLSTLYANDKYLLPANIIEFESGESITRDAVLKYQSVARNGYAELRAASAKEVGTGTKEVVLISDPECPYCEKLIANLIGLENEYTFKYVFFPLQSHAVGQLATYEMLCTDDGAERLAKITSLSALRDLKSGVQERLFASGKQPEMKLCDALTHKVGMVFAVFQKNSITNPSVPMLVFPDGTWISGTISRAKFEKLANRHQ